MNITKKFDRAFQWAGEKMGSEARTTMSDDFKQLETEMALRFDGESILRRFPRTKTDIPRQAWTGCRNP